MMNNEHISQKDWVQLFSTQKHNVDWMRLQSRIMEHVNTCDACRELYEKGMALQEAARDLASFEGTNRAGNAAFRKVASADGPKVDPARPLGRLCVCLDSSVGGEAFIEDTLELEGCANKYALNGEDDGRRLLDDDGALALTLSGGALTVRLAEGEPACECLLLSEDENDRRSALKPGSSVQIELPPDSFCSLEIVFTGK